MAEIYTCRCPGSRAERMTNWVVSVLRGNYSAFNGYRFTPSDYSEVRCERCGVRWRTKAAYVDTLPRAGDSDAGPPELVDDPSLPCALCVEWESHPDDPTGEPMIAVGPDGSVVTRVYSGLHAECSASVDAYVAETARHE